MPFGAIWPAENDNPAPRCLISTAHVLAGRVRRGSYDWLARAVDRILRPIADRLDKMAAVIHRQFRANSEQYRQLGCFGQIPPVMIDTVFQTGIAIGVDARLALERDEDNLSRFGIPIWLDL